MKSLCPQKRRAARSTIEPLEARIAPATVVSVNGGSLSVIGDSGGAAEVEALSFAVSGGNLLITDDNLQPVTPGAGANFVQPHQVSVALASITVDFTVNTGTGADVLSFNSALTLPGLFSATSGGAIIFSQSLTLASNGNLAANAGGTINLPNPASDLVTSGTGRVTLTTPRDIVMGSGSSITVENGPLTLDANLGGAAPGTFAGIALNGADLLSTGSGTIGLNGTGGNTGAGNFGILVSAGSQITSSSGASNAGTISLTGKGGVANGQNTGVVLTGSGSLVTSSIGAITITGTGQGADNGNIGVRMSDAAQVSSTGTGGAAASITIIGTGGGGMDANHGVLLEGTVADPSVTSVDGNIQITGQGGTAAIGQGARGISVEQGATVQASGVGSVTLMGTAGSGTGNRHGIFVGDIGTLVSAATGSVSLTGTGGTGGGAAGNNGVLIGNAGTISAQGAGTLTLTGTEGAGGNSEGIALIGNATVESTAGSGLSLIANNINIAVTANVNATSGTAKVRPRTVNAQIDFGGPDAFPNTLGLTTSELHQITGSLIEVGDANTGQINFTAPISPERNLSITTGMTASGVGAVTMVGNTNLTINATGGMSLGGAIVVGGTATFSANSISSISLLNFGNNFADVTILGGGGLGVAIREDSGFNLTGANIATTLTLQSNGTVTQSGAITGPGALIKDGTGTLILSSTNTYSGTTTINAGTLQVGNAGTTGTLGADSVTNSGALVFNRSNSLSVPNAIGGNGSLTQSGTGTLTLAGANGYTGTTSVDAGTLLVNGSLDASASVAVASGATLGGNGTINNATPTTVSGTLAPGGSPGALSTGNVTFNGSSTFSVEVNGSPAPQHDLLTVNGNVTLGNATLSVSGTVASSPGQLITVIENAGAGMIPDTFNQLAEGALVTINGVFFRITYAGGSGNDVVLAQAVLNTELTLAAGSLVISDVTAGGQNDTLTIRDETATNGIFIISDPLRVLGATGIPGAVSLDENTVTIPESSVTGTQIQVNTLLGDDTLTIDLSPGPLSKAIAFNAGGSAGVGDTLTLSGGTLASATFDFSSAQVGIVTLPSGGSITYEALEAILLTNTTADVTLNYNAGAATTIDLALAAGGRTSATSPDGPVTTFGNPTNSLTVNGGSGGDTITVNSLGAGFAAALAIDGQLDNDTVTLAAGLPTTLAGLTVVTETITAIPALTVGAGGVDITATNAIDINGGITSTGTVSLDGGGAITNTAGNITAPSLDADAVTGITLAIDGANIQVTNTTLGDITLNAVNNPVRITSADAGLGALRLNSGIFQLAKDAAIADAPMLVVNGTLDLNRIDEAVGNLSGMGTITNNPPTLATLTVGDDGDSSFAGAITGRVALTKIGTAKLTLSGTGNTYDGGTSITAGTLQFDAISAAINGAFDLSGGTLSYNLTGPSDSLSPTITFTEPSSIGVAAGKKVILTSVIAGRSGFTKTGAGTLVLDNEFNTFGGTFGRVRITDGTLQVATDGALGDLGNSVEIDDATFAAGGTFASGRYFVRTGGVAVIDVSSATLTLINKALADPVVQATFTPTSAPNLLFQFTYADGAGTPPPAVPFTDGTTLTFAGTGTAIVHTDLMGNLEAVELSGTNATTKLVINGPATGFTTIKRIVIDDVAPGTIASVGSIVLGKNVRLGDGTRDSVADLYVEGKTGKLQLYDINSYALLRLGEGLPYEILRPNGTIDKTKPQTKTNFPNLTIHEVRGPGVLVDLTPSDLPLDVNGKPVGGGGLGKIVVDTWDFTGPVAPATPGIPGGIRTTQSITSFKLLHSDCSVVFEVDKYHVGENTEGGVGEMNTGEGSWGSSGSEIEGGVGSFNAAGFLLGATLTAASMGKFNLGPEGFAGLLRLTDPDAPGVPTFIVNSNFTGTVDSESPLRKIKVNGDFAGDLEAPFIGSISAYSFNDTDPDHIATIHEINATDGALGTLTATKGIVRNFSITTDLAFKGFNVKLTKLTENTVGIDNVHIEAASIGKISVSLAASPTAPAGIELTGIKDSEFITSSVEETKLLAGSIGAVTVAITGVSTGSTATGIKDSTFDALVGAAAAPEQATRLNSLGNISVKINGQGGTSLGLSNATFAGNTIGTTIVTVNRSLVGANTGTAINVADYTASGAIGAFTISGNATGPQVTGLKVWSGHNVGAVMVKSTDLVNGTLKDSSILAGQLLKTTFDNLADQTKELGLAKLGAVTLSGSLTNTDLVAGGSIGAVSAGRSMTDSLILAGARLGGEGDFVIDGDETYQRAATIAAITVKGTAANSFSKTSIVAGVNPVDLVFGNTGDALALSAGFTAEVSRIGAIIIAAGTTGDASVANHQYAIQAAAITSLKVGATLTTNLTTARFIDPAVSTDDPTDVVVRVVTS